MHMQYKPDPEDALALPSFRSLYVLTGVIALLVGLDVLFWSLDWEGARNPLGLPMGFNLSLVAAILGGSRIVYGAIVGLLERDVGADLALAIAMVAAIILREYLVAAEVVLIAMVGESLEAITFARTQREIHKILELRPRIVRVRRGDREVEIPFHEVAVGDLVVIRPGERIAVDGSVLSGRSAVDQSTLTGESLPVDKGEGDPVFTGTLNQFGALEVRAEKVGDESTLGQVIQLVVEARERKAPVERTADRLVRYFLPFVLACAGVTFVYTNATPLGVVVGGITTGTAISWSYMPTLAVLVVACPCALILATPAAMMAALAWLARRGVLIKGGVALERLAGVTHFAFDKTGTLTRGELELGDVIAFEDREKSDVVTLAAAAEQSSEHLIAKVIVRSAAGDDLELPAVEDFLALPGAGVSALLRGDPAHSGRVLVGNRRLLTEQGVAIGADVDEALEKLEAAGQTPLLVSLEGRVVGAIGVRDTVRPEAAAVIRDLRRLGIENVALVTGDRRATAGQVAREVGIERVEAELRPDEKARWLAEWRGEGAARRGATARRGRPARRVAMVGDGVNDAPALASSDVGLALGGVGSDIAAEAGDLVLMGDPLTPLPGLLRLSRETVRVIWQNIVAFAFCVNLLGIVLTAWVMPTWSAEWEARSPVAAAVFHQIGSLLVLLNAMRLLWFERWHSSWAGRAEAAITDGAGRFLAGLWAARRRLAAGLAAVLVLGYLALGLVIIQADQVGLVKRFGRYAGTYGPGLHIGLPPPWQEVIRERPARVRRIEIGMRTLAAAPASDLAVEWDSPHRQGLFERHEEEAIMLTGDKSLVELGATIQYRLRADELEKYHFGASDPVEMLRALAEGALREVVATRFLLSDDTTGEGAGDLLTTGRGSLEGEVRRLLGERVDAWELGIEILPDGVCLQDVHPPLDVVSAFRDVSSAFKEMVRMKNEADADYRQQVIEAGGRAAWERLATSESELGDEVWNELRDQLGGEAATVLRSAEGFAEEKKNVATGNARRFELRREAQQGLPHLTRWRLYLDTVADALRGREKVIVDGDSEGRRHLFMGFPETLPAVLSPGDARSAATGDGEPVEEH